MLGFFDFLKFVLKEDWFAFEFALVDSVEFVFIEYFLHSVFLYKKDEAESFVGSFVACILEIDFAFVYLSKSFKVLLKVL